MIRSARLTPPPVREWLQSIATTPRRVLLLPVGSRSEPASFEDQPGDPIAKALLADERMENVWRLIGNWPGSLDLIQMAVRYSNPALLANLMTKERTAFGFAASSLSEMAAGFADVLESFSNTAEPLWGKPIEPLVKRLRKFAEKASQKASKAKAFYDFVPKPSFQGKGDPHQRAFRDAIIHGLEKLIEHHGGRFSKEDQDTIIATLASVVFPKWEIDAETVKRHRERQKSKQRAGGKVA